MRLFIFLLTLIFSNFTNAKDHLEPEISFYNWAGNFSDYETAMIKAFSETYEDNFILRLIVYPSFRQEYAIALKKVDKEYKLVKLQAEQQYWPSYLDRDYNNIHIERKEKKLNSKTAEGIITVWEEMLLRTKYRDYREEKSAWTDGTNYHFSMKSKERFSKALSGKVWSPEPDSNTGMLVDISNEMLLFVDDDVDAIKRLDEKTAELSEILNKKIIIVPSVPVLKIPK